MPDQGFPYDNGAATLRGRDDHADALITHVLLKGRGERVLIQGRQRHGRRLMACRSPSSKAPVFVIGS